MSAVFKLPKLGYPKLTIILIAFHRTKYIGNFGNWAILNMTFSDAGFVVAIWGRHLINHPELKTSREYNNYVAMKKTQWYHDNSWYIYICTSSKYSSNYVDVYKYVICCFTKHSPVGLPTLNWRAWPVEPGRHRPCTLQWKEVRSVRNFGNSIRITLVECDGSARSAHFTVLHTSTYMLLVVEFLQIAIFQPHLLQEWIKRWGTMSQSIFAPSVYLSWNTTGLLPVPWNWMKENSARDPKSLHLGTCRLNLDICGGSNCAVLQILP